MKILSSNNLNFKAQVKFDKIYSTDYFFKDIKELYPEMDLTKIIVLPSNYLEDDIHLNSIKFSLKKHYEYLDKDVVNYSVKDDRIVVNVLVDEDETIVLNNIEFFENDNKLEMKINSNTRSSDVVTLSVGDKYTEGEFITRMKNNGYVCK